MIVKKFKVYQGKKLMGTYNQLHLAKTNIQFLRKWNSFWNLLLFKSKIDYTIKVITSNEPKNKSNKLEGVMVGAIFFG